MNWEKEEQIWKEREKSGRFFHLVLLTGRAGYATDHKDWIYYPFCLIDYSDLPSKVIVAIGRQTSSVA